MLLQSIRKLIQRKLYNMTLNNSKFSITYAEDKVVRFVDFHVIWAKVSTRGDGFVIKFEDSNA